VSPQDNAHVSAGRTIDGFDRRSSRTGQCPSFDALTAFVERRLASAERDLIVGHLAQCEACYFAVTETAAAMASPDHKSVWRHATALASAAVLMLAAAASLLLWQRHTGSMSIMNTAANPAVSTTSAATQPSALPAPAPTGGTQERPQQGPEDRLARALAIYGAATKGKGGTKVPATYTPAREPNDRAASFLAHLNDVVGAFDAAGDPPTMDARLNLALALETMSASLREESVRAWEKYLAAGPDPDQAREARQHLRALKAMRATERR
jgi:hypothetical protein